ncbi:MAG TPA: PhnD/SsuA/transferrin family substrate-binding protein [Candidatus Limiplasma sp.]|nr:PhnD/SsuA/transferrin family substrate-binding protein [Candidatus Limiplasma sp.]HPS81385.1 PhnD/SsuA/transferrin family substrate-binding protein [Candidatus Limiplasma sp.]
MNKQGLLRRFTVLLTAVFLMVGMIVPMAGASSSDTITIVWYPNESAADYQSARDAFGKLITEATGKQVDNKLTTDYSIAIEALASGQAQICFMGAQGYIQAKDKNAAVAPLFVNSGASGTLDDAIYYSWMCVNQGQEDQYKDGDAYSIANIQGKKMSFVSNSSTSGFKVPTTNIIAFFSKQDAWKNITSDDLVEGGSDKFFSEVLFGGSHQGSAYNLISGAADVAAFCDTELAPYADCTAGTEEKAGAVYTIKADATAPFDTVTGKSFVIIQSTPVLNGPFAYNSESLSADDAKKIQDRFLSADVASNPDIFITAEGKEAGKVGMFKKTDKECFLLVDDAWYNPIREMAQ